MSNSTSNRCTLLWSQRLIDSNVLVRHYMDLEDDKSVFVLLNDQEEIPLLTVDHNGILDYPESVKSLIKVPGDKRQKFILTDNSSWNGFWTLHPGVTYWSTLIDFPTRFRYFFSDPDSLLKAEQSWAFLLATHLWKDLVSIKTE